MKRVAPLPALALALTLSAPPVIAAEPLGRLFFTPDQRASLDTARTKRTRNTVATEESAAEKPPPPPQPEHVTYGGLVRRSDGKTTVWLNDRAVQDKDLGAGSSITGRIRPDGSVTIQGAQSGRSVDLKVGQSAELLSGTVEERYTRSRTAPKPEAKPEDKPATKPGADAGAATAAAPARGKEDRERDERIENAVKAMEAAAAKLPAPAAPVQVYPPPSR